MKPHGGTRCNTTTKSHCSATPTHQVPPTNNNSTHRAATRPPSHNKVKHQPPCFCHHTHTQAVDQQGSHTKRHMVMVMVASVEPHHKPVVSHGSSHVVFCLATTHSQVAHTHAHTHTRDSGRRCGGKHGVDETTHTPHHEHHALKPKWQAHTMPSQWLSQSMVHCALACVCGQATCCTHAHAHTGKWRDHRSQAANTQATTNNHHTNTLQTSLMVVTHTQAGHSHTHQGQAGQGAQQDQGSGGNGLHSDHAMAQACNTSGHATMACAPSPRATHASGHVHTHTHSATHTQEGEKRGVGRGATRSGEAQWRERDCATVPPTLPTSVHTTHCAPCQSTTWSTIHHPPTTSE